jgi:hypothetical protein
MSGSLWRGILALSFGALLAFASASAQPTPMPFDPDAHRWEHRLLVAFAPSREHAALRAQREALAEHLPALRERDLLWVEVWAGGGDADGRPLAAASAEQLRARYDVPEGAFTVLLVGKDGGVKRRETAVVLPRDVFAQIDQMPMRRREMRERSDG